MTPLVRRARRPSRVLTLVVAGWVLLVVAEAGPRVVHRLLDPHGRARCQVRAASDHAPAITGAPVPVARVLQAAEQPVTARAPAPRFAGARPPTGRSPPPASSAAA